MRIVHDPMADRNDMEEQTGEGGKTEKRPACVIQKRSNQPAAASHINQLPIVLAASISLLMPLVVETETEISAFEYPTSTDGEQQVTTLASP
jgi:hypothetical protein